MKQQKVLWLLIVTFAVPQAGLSQGMFEQGGGYAGVAGLGAGLAAGGRSHAETLKHSFEAVGRAQQAIQQSVQEQTAIIEHNMKLGCQYEAAKQWESAENAFKWVLQGVAHRDGPGSPAAVPALKHLVNISEAQEKLDDAIGFQKTVVAFGKTAAKGLDPSSLAKDQIRLSELYCKKNDYSTAEPILRDLVQDPNPYIKDEQRCQALANYYEVLQRLNKKPYIDPRTIAAEPTQPIEEPKLTATEQTKPVEEPKLTATEQTKPVEEPMLSATELTKAMANLTATEQTRPVGKPKLTATDKTMSVEEAKVTATKDTKPEEAEATATERTKPVEETKVAATERTTPVEEAKVTATEQTKPVEETKVAATEQTKPVEEPQVTATEQTKSVEEPQVTATATEQTGPVEEPKATATETTKAVEEPKLIASEKTMPGEEAKLTTTERTKPDGEPMLTATEQATELATQVARAEATQLLDYVMNTILRQRTALLNLPMNAVLQGQDVMPNKESTTKEVNSKTTDNP
jgi:hypothetical protein